jgi:hypothetical protein
MHATSPVLLTLLQFIILIMSDDECKLWSYSLHYFILCPPWFSILLLFASFAYLRPSTLNADYLLSLSSGTPRNTTDWIQIRSFSKLELGERVCQRGPSHFSSVSCRYVSYPMEKGSPRLATAALRPSLLKVSVISERWAHVPVFRR